MQAATFRPATEADIPALVDLVTSAYRGDASRAGWTTVADLLEGARIDPDVLRTDILRPCSRVLVVDGADGPLACAHVAEEDGAGYFGMFAVRPGLQGSGLGGRRPAGGGRVAREEGGVGPVRRGGVDPRDDLIAWYERRGDGRAGRHLPVAGGDGRFGVPRREDLRFEILERRLEPAP